MLTLVRLIGVVFKRFAGHIHLATENGLEFLRLILDLAVDAFDEIEEFLDAIHIAVVGEGYARHTVGHSFLDQRGNRCLAVEHGVLRVYV